MPGAPDGVRGLRDRRAVGQEVASDAGVAYSLARPARWEVKRADEHEERGHSLPLGPGEGPGCGKHLPHSSSEAASLRVRGRAHGVQGLRAQGHHPQANRQDDELGQRRGQFHVP